MTSSSLALFLILWTLERIKCTQTTKFTFVRKDWTIISWWITVLLRRVIRSPTRFEFVVQFCLHYTDKCYFMLSWFALLLTRVEMMTDKNGNDCCLLYTCCPRNWNMLYRNRHKHDEKCWPVVSWSFTYVYWMVNENKNCT